MVVDQGLRAGRPEWVTAIAERFDVVLFDVGNTLVAQAPPATAVADLVAVALPQVKDALQALHGAVTMGVVSNTTVMDAETLRIHLAEAGLAEYCETIVASADLGVHKPDPAPLQRALDALGVRPDRALYVGDLETDRQAAHAAGMAFCYTGPDLAWSLERHLLPDGGPVRGAAGAVRAPDEEHRRRCLERFDRLAKPPGSLGRLETVVAQLAAVGRRDIPDVDPVAVAVFVGDHMVAESDIVTPWPWTITREVAALLADGRGLAAVTARSVDAYLEVIDVGLATGPTPAGVRPERIRSGAGDIRSGFTMERGEAIAAIEVGVRTAERHIGGGSRTLCVGEVGIGNTTSAAALIAWMAGRDPGLMTGPGSGIPDGALMRKRQIVTDAVTAVPADADPIEVLCRLGGLEIAAMAGYMIGAASLGVPVILDGVITLAAACIADRLAPGTNVSLVAAHRSPEPATSAALALLDLEPLFDMAIRTGEGVGALLAIPLLRAARAALADTALLDEL